MLQQRLSEAREPEPQRTHAVLTLRMTPQQHAALKAAAHRQMLSLNRLCLAGLLAALDELNGTRVASVAAQEG